MSEDALQGHGGAPAEGGKRGHPEDEPREGAPDRNAGSAGNEPNLEALLKEETALKERYLAGWQRAQADLENFKKRVAREQAEFRASVVEGLVKDMLPALDSLERAIKHAKAGTAADEAVARGLDLVLGKFLEFLEKEGIKPISAAGEAYDPMRHEAILRVPTDAVEEGVVLEEVQRGYASKDRVIRPALVTVACRPDRESGRGAAAAEPRHLDGDDGSRSRAAGVNDGAGEDAEPPGSEGGTD